TSRIDLCSKSTSQMLGLCKLVASSGRVLSLCAALPSLSLSLSRSIVFCPCRVDFPFRVPHHFGISLRVRQTIDFAPNCITFTTVCVCVRLNEVISEFTSRTHTPSIRKTTAEDVGLNEVAH